MAAADSLVTIKPAPQSRQVCVICKARKKACDKILPQCGYCTKRNLNCRYTHRERKHDAVVSAAAAAAAAGIQRDSLPTPPETAASSTPPPQSVISFEPVISEMNIYLQVQGFIRSTGQFVDDITSSYFQDMHGYFPIISRTRFHKNLLSLGSAPSADFSVLLIALCLVMYMPGIKQAPGRSISKNSLYLAARSLFAQIQVLSPPSVHLIQAGILIAVYEYGQRQPDHAFVTIAGCARMAYAMQLNSHASCELPEEAPKSGPIEELLEAEEAANTWWGIIIYERTFYPEVKFHGQPLITQTPGDNAPLPIEAAILDRGTFLDPESLSHAPVSDMYSPKVGGFGRAAQEALLRDQVLKAFSISDIDARLDRLEQLNAALHEFLTLTMAQCNSQNTYFCAGIANAFRTMFILHSHILDLPSNGLTPKARPMEEWCQHSRAALDTVTKMTIEVTRAHEYFRRPLLDSIPVNFIYTVNTVLRYIHNIPDWAEDDWLREAEERLQESLRKAYRRWLVELE